MIPVGGPDARRRRACQIQPQALPSGRVNPHAGLAARRIVQAHRSGVGPERSGPIVPAAAQPERTEHGIARVFDAPASRSRRAFRPSHAALEPENGALHLRRPQRHPHHRSGTERAAAAAGPRGGPRGRRRRRPRAVRRHQAAGAGGDHRGGQALRPVLRQLSLARRHADQLQDDLAVDQAAARARGAHRPPSRAA